MVELKSLQRTDDAAGAQRIVHSVIEQRSMIVVYQPIVDHVQNRVFGYEALTRPMLDGKMIQPDRWFRVAHDNQCFVEADLLALACIFEDTASLPHRALSMPIFVNVMPSSLSDPAFLKGLEYMIAHGVCEPEQLVFEMVEYVDYDPRSLSEVVATLQSFGARIALDDFGVEGAHKESISELEPDFVKIDRSLIQGIAECTRKQSRLMKLVQQIDSSNYCVIAEGIENTEDLLVVEETGITFTQGYHWGRPVPSNELHYLIHQIESEKSNLADMVKHKQDVLTHDEVVRKSEEIDRLIVRYHQLKGRK